MIAFCSGLSILIGCFGALYQKRLKRLLAYSSINNVGYALAGLVVANAGGLQAALVYLFFYNMALLLFFSFLLGAFGSRRLTYVSDIRFLRKSSYCSIVVALCLFSMAGIPPLSGFFIKFFVLSELVYSKYYLLAAIGTFSSIISSFYYIALIKTLFFEDSGTENLEEFLYQKAAYQPPLVAFTGALAFFFIAYPLFPGFINSIFTELALGLTLPFM